MSPTLRLSSLCASSYMSSKASSSLVESQTAPAAASTLRCSTLVSPLFLSSFLAKFTSLMVVPVSSFSRSRFDSFSSRM